MKLSAEGRLRASVRAACAAGATAAILAAGSAVAQEAAAPAAVPAAEQEASTQLEKVEVTGTRIKRVDVSTSNPVFTIDRRTIEATGVATLGELIQSIPIVTGAVTNTQVNNGGGAGAADVALRGLTSARTLVLLDGLRIVSGGPTDVNALPASMIERIEILKQGASAIYGSDAIGGVVNFITRKNFNNGELAATYSRSQQNDAAAYDGSLTWGSSTGSGNVVLGLNYNRQDEIRSSDRSVTSAPFGFYYGELSPNFGTSSRTPTGRFRIPGGGGVTNENGDPCGTVTRKEGTTGSSPSDFRCFKNNFGPGASDRYNFQPENLALTPQRRNSLFGLTQQSLDYGLKFYGSAFYNNTKANAQLAPEPFDNGTNFAIFGEPVVISGQSMYNPFQQDISTYALRATLAGNRLQVFDTDTYQATAGLKGTLLDRYSWDAALTYGRILQTSSQTGFLNFTQLQQQLGPSFNDPVNGPTCGVQGSYTIPGCTPINILGTQGDNIANLSVTAHDRLNDELSQFSANITGDIAQMRYGPLAAAFGVEFRKENLTFSPDSLAAGNHLSENNSGPTAGSTVVREVYGEFNVPLLNDMLMAHSLSASLGVRHSAYSLFGGTTNAKYGLEWRPYADLLVRGTYTDVFRAPTITDLFGGPAQNAPPYDDPCNGLETPVGQEPNTVDKACGNVARDGSYSQDNTQASTTLESNSRLGPESGYAIDYGFVFNPSFYSPLTVELDFWKYSVDDSIETQSIQTSLDGCFNFGVLCENIERDANGQLSAGHEPKANVGSFSTSGFDLGLRLSYPNTRIMDVELGNFVVGADTTYLKQFDFRAIQDGFVLSAVSPAGTYEPNVFGGSFPRLRLNAYVFWNMGPWSATLSDYLVGDQSETGIDLGDGGECAGATSDRITVTNPDGSSFTLQCRRNIGFVNYVDTSASYNLKAYRTTFTFGIRDFFDQSSPLVVGGFNGATDTGAYRIEGRSFYAKVKVLLK